MKFFYLTISGGALAVFLGSITRKLKKWLKVVQEVRHGTSIVLVPIL